jgi:hypothetical protein
MTFSTPTDADYIESVDFFDSDWIKTGMKEDRLVYRHFFNERTHKALFYAARRQRRLGLEAQDPADMQIMIGSQWWCLRRRTVEGCSISSASGPTWCASSAPPGSRTRRSSRRWCATWCPTGRSARAR